jgi:hypothetical protein
MVVVEVGEAFASCLRGKRRLVHPSMLGGVGYPPMPPPHPGPLQQRWLTAGWAHGGTRMVSKGGKAQVAELVGDELETPKMKGFAKGKTFAW